MAGEWRWRDERLGDLVRITHGWPFKSDFFSDELSGRPIVVNIGNFRYTGGFRFETTTAKEYRDEYPKEYELSPGDILLVMTCQTAGGEILGIPARVPKDGRTYLHNQRLGKVVIKEPSSVDPDYLYWLFLWSEFNRELCVTASGTKILHTAPSRIEAFKFRLPPLPTQRAIALILGTLDDKIELNRRMNETLEAMARALFKSWFVDFDPVRAKMEGRKPAGMDKATAALFPDSFQDSPLGKIPKGWEVARLGDHVDAVKGLSYKGSGLSDAGIPLHNLNSVYEGGGYKFEGVKHYTGDFRDRHLVRPGDLIVANTEQGHDCLLIGYAAIVPRTFGDLGLFSHHIYRVRPLEGSPVTPAWLCYFLNSPAMHDTVSGYANGTTVNMLPVAGLQHPAFVLPPLGTIQKFGDLAMAILGRHERMVTENRTLAALRDALLPKLLSGEIRVEDAERLVEFKA